MCKCATARPVSMLDDCGIVYFNPSPNLAQYAGTGTILLMHTHYACCILPPSALAYYLTALQYLYSVYSSLVYHVCMISYDCIMYSIQ